MDWINLYGWAIPNQDDFLQRYQDDESLYQMAQNFWNDTSFNALIFIIAMILVGVAMWAIHYFVWCKKPGRHYRPLWWLIQCGITFVLTLGITIGLQNGLVNTDLIEVSAFQIKIALVNGFYGVIIYFLCSLVTNLFFPKSTCAYPFLYNKRK